MQIRKHLIIATLALTVGLAACATPGKYDDLSPQRYINRAASADTFEVMSSQLALQRSQDPEVRAFAQAMIEQHMQSSQMLIASLAGRKDQTVAVPAPGLMLPEQRDTIARLQSSTMFDRDYVMAQITAHDDALMLNRAFADDSNNELLVKNAKAVLPHIEMHRDAIGKIMTRMQSQPQAMQPIQPVIVQ